jgi:hypothetical protein
MSGNGHELGLAAEKGRRKMVLPLGLCPLIARGDKLTVGNGCRPTGGPAAVGLSESAVHARWSHFF